MLERNIIEPSEGPWSSGIVWIRKKDHDNRTAGHLGITKTLARIKDFFICRVLDVILVLGVTLLIVQYVIRESQPNLCQCLARPKRGS